MLNSKAATKLLINLNLSNICVWDQRPGIRKNAIPHPWSKRHRIPDPEPQHLIEVII
jgi:hypothetical protein